MAKKMLLVDPSSTLLKTNPVPNPLSETFLQIDSDIKQILETPTMSEHNKVLAYQQALRNYLIKSKQIMNQNQTENQSNNQMFEQNFDTSSITTKQPSTTTTTTPTERQIDIEQQAVDSLPKTLRDKGRLIMNHIKKASGIKWNERGELLHAGKPIAGSNLTDLVNEIVRARKLTGEPIGWNWFAQALKESNIPQNLIGNKTRWDHFNKSTPSPSYQTPPNSIRQPTARKQLKPVKKWLTFDNV